MTNSAPTSKLRFALEDFTQDELLYKPYWSALLSDERTAYMDHDKDSCWLRLKSFLAQTGLKIVSLSIHFRNRVVKPLPDNAAGYFFRQKSGAFTSSKKTRHSFVVGHYDGQKLITQSWRVPELILEETEERDINDTEKVGPSLITF